MTIATQPRRLHQHNRSVTFFRWGLLALFLFSLIIRFWNLGRFNMLVFDEVYYVNFANNYLTQSPFFDGHPPLSKYILAIGIWIGNHLPWGQNIANTLTDTQTRLTTFSYRWLNALLGSFIPVLIACLSYQISHRRVFAWIAGLFAAVDGLLLVESRYALNNVHLLLFGLLGHWCLLSALERPSRQRISWLVLAGLNFGAAIAIKWNGLWFLLVAYLIWAIAWGIKFLPSSLTTRFPDNAQDGETPVQRLTQLSLMPFVLFLGIVPIVFYSLTWIPHLHLNPLPDFIGVHQEILSYHERIAGNEPHADPNCLPWPQAFFPFLFPSTPPLPICYPKVHPYCSSWFTWILMIRPVVYLYETARSVDEAVPVIPPPPAEDVKVIYDVHAMGNPVLWWFAAVAIVCIAWLTFDQIFARWRGSKHLETLTMPLSSTELWCLGYMIAGYAVNLLPWVRVTRCTFIYHYMGAAIFSWMALAWLCDRWLASLDSFLRTTALTVIFLTIASFVWWLPLFLGLPLSPEALRVLRLLPTW